MKKNHQKILYLGTDLYSVGGIQRYCNYQIRAIKESKLFIKSISLNPPSNVYFRKMNNIDFHSFGPTLIGKMYYLILAFYLAVRYRPHIIVCSHINLTPVVKILKIITSAKSFLNIYGLEIWSQPKKLIIKRLHVYDSIIGDCRNILDYVSDFLSDESLYLLYDPIDEEWVENAKKNYTVPSNSKFSTADFIILTVGRLERQKGHSEVINILNNLPRTIVYQILGDGFMKEELSSLVKSLKLEDRVEFLGRVSDDELANYYQRSDLVLLISSVGKDEGEGLPMGAIEGSSFGKPIIVGNQDGSREAISMKYINGVSIDPKDSDRLRSHILKYYKEPNLKQLHGEAGRKFSKKYFGYKSFKSKLLEILLK